MVGRSNVGKSTLINALAQKTIARTSAAPGKTRLANFYLIQSPIPNLQSPAFYLVDLPGYGYARGGRDAAEEFEALTAQYFDAGGDEGRVLAGVLQLIDARHPDLSSDIAAHRWVKNTVATKIDKLKQSGRARTQQVLKAHYETQILTTSAPDGIGMKELWKLLRLWTARQ